jgi:hypothetical protein
MKLRSYALLSGATRTISFLSPAFNVSREKRASVLAVARLKSPFSFILPYLFQSHGMTVRARKRPTTVSANPVASAGNELAPCGKVSRFGAGVGTTAPDKVSYFQRSSNYQI